MNTAESIKNLKLESTIKPIAYLIDGLSTDLSGEDIIYLKSIYDYVASDLDKGIYDAMNKGLSLCRNSHVMMINSGDIISTEILMWKNLHNLRGHTVYYGDWVNGETVCKPLDWAMITIGYFPLNHQAMIIPRDIYYNDSYKICGDLEFLCRLIQLKYNFEYLSFSMVAYEGGGVSSKRTFRKFIEKNKIVLTYYGLYGFIRAIYYQVYQIIRLVIKKVTIKQ